MKKVRRGDNVHASGQRQQFCTRLEDVGLQEFGMELAVVAVKFTS